MEKIDVVLRYVIENMIKKDRIVFTEREISKDCYNF